MTHLFRCACFAFFMLATASQAAVPLLDTYYSPRNAERPVRTSTRFVILHTTEGSARGSGSKLKQNGEANYMIDEAGRIYRIIDRKRVAYHCGRSMWNGLSSLDNCSIGIEVVGYHNKEMTAAQYKALKSLLDELKGIYRISDDRILTHSMVAYGAPNQWHKKSHRGRKRCGMRMALPSVRRKLGLNSKPAYDPDVKAGRLVVADKALQQVLYSVEKKTPTRSRKQQTATIQAPKQQPAKQGGTQPAIVNKGFKAAEPQPSAKSSGELTIGIGQTAWDVARAAYNSQDTLYVFPSGTRKRGNEITNWKMVPSGTKVVLNAPAAPGVGPVAPVARQPVAASEPPTAAPQATSSDDETLDEASAVSAYDAREAGGNVIGPGKTAWDIARDAYASSSTIYEFPSGEKKRGDEIKNWKAMPTGTRVTLAAGDDNEPETAVSIGEIAADGAHALRENEDEKSVTPAPTEGSASDAAVTQGKEPGAATQAGVLAVVAGAEWNSERTIYVTGKGQCIKGSELDAEKLALLTPDTKVFSGYRLGGPITAQTPAFAICGPIWRDSETMFLLPDGRLISGDKVDPQKIPAKTMILFKD